MSITALLWAALYGAAVIGTFFNPIFGCVGYLLEYYMRPELKWWGDQLPELRYNLIISLALGASFLLRRGSLPTMRDFRNPALLCQFGLLATMLLVTATAAVNPTVSWEYTFQWVKMALIFPLLVYGSIRSRSTFDLFVIAHMLGAFWWGWETYLDPEREQSRLLNVGSADTLNDNAASAHLLTVLPFTIIYALTEPTKWKRIVGFVALPFVVNTIVLCNSRGATVALAAGMLAAIVIVRRGYRFRMILATIASALVVYMLADQQFIDRQKTTTQYEQDNSAQERLSSWQGAYRLVEDRPYGAGARGFVFLSPKYIPEIVAAHDGELRAPHNTWALVISEWGIVGFACYIGVLSFTFLMLRRIKRNARPENWRFYYWRAMGLQLALIAYLVAGTFTDRYYAEAGWWMIALTYGLYRLQLTEQAAEILAEQAAEKTQPTSGFGAPTQAYAQ